MMSRKKAFELKRIIGQGGFEPPTSWSRTKRATPALLPVCAIYLNDYKIKAHHLRGELLRERRGSNPRSPA